MPCRMLRAGIFRVDSGYRFSFLIGMGHGTIVAKRRNALTVKRRKRRGHEVFHC